MGPEIEQFRKDSLRYFAATVAWISSASRLLDVVVRKNKLKTPLVNSLRRDVRYKIAEFNQKSDFIFQGIVNGKIPMEAISGEFEEQSEVLQKELKELKVKLDSIVML
jgi:hypothetical protein